MKEYTIKSPILGFEDMDKVKLEKIDELFVTLRSMENEQISMTLANPYLLREYSFDVPRSIKALLDINENSKLSVYNVVVIQEPLNESCVNFLAPIVFNEDNQSAAQIVLDKKRHPDFGMNETIRSLKQ